MDIDLAALPDDVDTLQRMVRTLATERINLTEAQAEIERLRLKSRTIFRIANPFVGPETPFADKRLWFDPQTYR